MKNKRVDKYNDVEVKDEILQPKETKKKVKTKKEKTKNEKVTKDKAKKKNKKEEIKKQIPTKEKKIKKKKKYKLKISILMIIVSFIFILLGIFVTLVATGIINLEKDKEPIYYSLSEKLKVGHYVAYDAGIWEEDKEVPNRSVAYTLGGYKKDTSRNDGITCNYISEEEYLEQKRSGWRVFSIEDGIVTLIHDGISMCYYHGYGNNTNDKSVKILSGNDENISFDYYLDNKFADSVKIMSKEDIDKFNKEDSGYKRINNDLISVGIPYWLATQQGNTFMWYVTENGTVATDQVGLYGVRIMVRLRGDVKTTGLTNNKEWMLALEEEKKDK